MEFLYKLHTAYLNNLKPSFRRNLIDEIEWSERLIGLKGARGVGKSTLLLQHIKEKFKTSNKALYVSLDSFIMNNNTILDVAEFHTNNGGTHLFLDEIHKYENWSRELKTIYDLYPRLHVAFTSSSILHIYKGFADLSRRAITYDMHGLSFREFLEIETGKKFKTYTLKEILAKHGEIASEICEDLHPLEYFKKYLKHGYYPIYLQGEKMYPQKLTNVINLILDIDLPYILGVDIQNVSKIKKLLYLLASAVPFQPNVSKLSVSMELTRGILNTYLNYLKDAHLINLLLSNSKNYSIISKPEKIYLHNTNLAYAINPEVIQIGTLRETFFYNQLNNTNKVNTAESGDFLINEKYVFEVGGKNKTFSQIANIKNSYLAVDEMEIGYKNRIPLWLFGFLY